MSQTNVRLTAFPPARTNRTKQAKRVLSGLQQRQSGSVEGSNDTINFNLQLYMLFCCYLVKPDSTANSLTVCRKCTWGPSWLDELCFWKTLSAMERSRLLDSARESDFGHWCVTDLWSCYFCMAAVNFTWEINGWEELLLLGYVALSRDKTCDRKMANMSNLSSKLQNRD